MKHFKGSPRRLQNGSPRRLQNWSPRKAPKLEPQKAPKIGITRRLALRTSGSHVATFCSASVSISCHTELPAWIQTFSFHLLLQESTCHCRIRCLKVLSCHLNSFDCNVTTFNTDDLAGRSWCGPGELDCKAWSDEAFYQNSILNCDVRNRSRCTFRFMFCVKT